MTFLFLAPLGFSLLFIASAGQLCSAEDKGGCVNLNSFGAALVQRKLHSSVQVVADEGDDSPNMGTKLDHALSLVTQLADKSGGHSWNTTDDEQLALQVIKEMIDDLFNGSLIQYKEDQLEVDAARDRIQNCTNDKRNTHTDVITPGKNAAHQSRTEHEQCRERENLIIMNTSQECTTYHNYRKNPDNFDPFPNCMAAHLTFETISTDVYDVKHDMEDCLVATVNTMEPLYEEYLGCKESNDRRKAVSEECGREQEEFEGDFCDYASKLAQKCSDYEVCRSNSIGARNRTHAEVKKAEEARKADWKTATHILCLLGVFESDNANKSALLKECAWANVSTSNITLVYHTIPPADDCPVESFLPCDEAWLQTEYKSKAWYNSSSIHTCSPCPGLFQPCMNGAGTPLPDQDEIVACESDISGHDISNAPGCGEGWHVCSGSQVHQLGVTFSQARSFSGCYAYDSNNDCGSCAERCGPSSQYSNVLGPRPCPVGGGSDPDLSAMGNSCHSQAGTSDCPSGGRINSGNPGCTITTRSLSGVMCCKG